MNAVDEEGRTALMNAAESGQIAVASTLADAGANLNMKTASGDTALNYAISSGNTELVEELLKHTSRPEHQRPIRDRAT